MNVSRMNAVVLVAGLILEGTVAFLPRPASAQAPAPSVVWMLDRSVSMQGYSRKDFQSFLGGAIGALGAAMEQRTYVPARHARYYTVADKVESAKDERTWFGAGCVGGNTDLEAALKTLVTAKPSLGILMTDGLPSDAASLAQVCSGAGAPSVKNLPSWQALASGDRGLWVAVVGLPFDGTFYMNCGAVDPVLEAQIKQRYGRKVACGKECKFHYKGIRPLLVVVTSSLDFVAEGQAFVERLRVALRGANPRKSVRMEAARIWPPHEVSPSFSSRWGYRWKGDVQTADLPQRTSSRGVAIFQKKDLECYAHPTQMVGLEFRMEPGAGDSPSLPAAIRARVDLLPLHPDEVTDKGAIGVLHGRDAEQTRAWLRPTQLPPGLDVQGAASCASVFRSLRSDKIASSQMDTADDCPDGDCFRVTSFCGCIGKHLRPKNPSDVRRLGIQAVKRYENRLQDELSPLLDWSTSHPGLDPDRLYGLRVLVEDAVGQAHAKVRDLRVRLGVSVMDISPAGVRP